MKKILVLHGPNLNLLGTREPEVYGKQTLADINKSLVKRASELQVELTAFQSNSEAELIDIIQQSVGNKIDYFIINLAAFTHTSIALRDAFLAVNIPFIEVHISNLAARDSFRQRSYFADIAQGSICGLGARGYFLALQAIVDQFNQREF